MATRGTIATASKWSGMMMAVVACAMLVLGAIGCDTKKKGSKINGGSGVVLGGGNNPSNPPASATATNGSGGATGTSTSSYNGRSYRLFVPSTYSAATPSAVVVAMHGYGDTYTNFFTTATGSGWQAAANAENFIFVSPAHTNSSRPSFLHFSGANFSLSATLAEAASLLEAIYYGVGAAYNIETTQIYWIGFSEGATFCEVASTSLNPEIRAIAPYAGAVSGKPFPYTRAIPAYGICGTSDGSFSSIQSAFSEWQTAGHTNTSAWVNGVGHSFSQLCSFGPTPTAVYQWLKNASAGAVQSSFDPNHGGGGANPGTGTGGSGGQYPGSFTVPIAVQNLGTQNIHIYVPNSYSPATPMPMLIGLHGAGGPGTAPAAAQQVRNDWATVAATQGFIVVAIEATGSQGGYIVNEAGMVINAAITEMYATYNIDTKRVYGWGFSAGGHLMHLLALDNSNFFAAYGVSAGVLAGLASQYGVGPSTAARKIPCAIHIGTTDQLHPHALNDRTAFQNAGWSIGSTLQFTEFSGGHTYSTTHLSQIWQFIGSKSLP